MYATLPSPQQMLPASSEIRVLTDLGVYHHGIVGLGGIIFHSRKQEGVIKSSMQEFAFGKKIELLRVPKTQTQRDEILKRCHIALGKPYNLFMANCEQFTSWAWGEVPHSRQLTTFALTALSLVGGTLAALHNK